MIPRLHPKGASFRGLGAYVLHDKDHAPTSERVGFTATRNMATNDPHVAIRVMAAVAMDQDRLKAEAGVKNTGRKSVKSVLHATLSWAKHETTSREEKEQAADSFLIAMGAQEHQAIYAEHTDEEHEHLHLIINRVHPESGKMLSSSKERLRASSWAEQYERERGEILCEQRAINNAARARGEFTRGKAAKTRAEFERDGAANDNRDPAETKKLAELARRGRDLAERHIRAFEG